MRMEQQARWTCSICRKIALAEDLETLLWYGLQVSTNVKQNDKAFSTQYVFL